MEDDPSLCGKCPKLVKSDQNALLCEICLCWYHLKCTGLTCKDYKILLNDSLPAVTALARFSL